jgi:hypothetical protein
MWPNALNKIGKRSWITFINNIELKKYMKTHEGRLRVIKIIVNLLSGKKGGLTDYLNEVILVQLWVQNKIFLNL